MEDFREAHNKVIKLQNAPEPQTGFIASRLNKDNLFNVLFFAILAGGTAIAFATGIMLLSWLAIAVSIWLVKRNSQIIFDKKSLQFTINNKKVKASGGEIIIMLFASFGITALVGFILDGLNVKDSPFILGMMMSLFAFIPVLYCIIRNLPIAVYFKKEAWTSLELTGGSSSSSSSHFEQSKRNSMSYSHLPNNVWYSSHVRRYRR